MRHALASKFFLLALFGSGCATIFRGKQGDLVLREAPADLAVTDQGTQVALTKDSGAGAHTVYLAQMPRGRSQVLLKSGRAEATAELSSHFAGGWLVADILLGFWPLLIDALTKAALDYDEVPVDQAFALAAHRPPPLAQPATVAAASPGKKDLGLFGSGFRSSEQVPAAAPATGAAAQPTQPQHGAHSLAGGKLAVLDFKNFAKDLKPEDVRYFTDIVRGQSLKTAPQLEVMTRENLLVLLQASGKDATQCEGECEVDTGRRIGADAIITGEILKVGSHYKLSLKLHDTREGRLLSTALASGRSIDELDESAQAAATELLGPVR